jgi:hypothetical protein
MRVEFLERKYSSTALDHLIDRFGLELIRKTFAGHNPSDPQKTLSAIPLNNFYD